MERESIGGMWTMHVVIVVLQTPEYIHGIALIASISIVLQLQLKVLFLKFLLGARA